METNEMASSMGVGPIIFMIAFAALMIAAQWKIYSKAGKPGWACIIPIYNLIVLLEIIKKPVWWFLLMLIPFVNIIILIIIALQLAKVFGKGSGFGLGLVFLAPIFYPILGFGDAKYEG